LRLLRCEQSIHAREPEYETRLWASFAIAAIAGWKRDGLMFPIVDVHIGTDARGPFAHAV
jgi:hypothetical protein